MEQTLTDHQSNTTGQKPSITVDNKDSKDYVQTRIWLPDDLARENDISRVFGVITLTIDKRNYVMGKQ